MALPSRGWAETEHSVTCNLLPRNCYCYLPSRQIAKALYDEDSSVNDCHRERVPTPPGSEVVGGRAHLNLDSHQCQTEETVMLRQKHIPYLQTNKSSISRYTKRSFYKHSSCQAVVAHASCQHSRGRGRQADLCEFQDSHATEKLSRKRQNKLSQNKKQRLPSQLPQKQKQK